MKKQPTKKNKYILTKEDLWGEPRKINCFSKEYYNKMKQYFIDNNLVFWTESKGGQEVLRFQNETYFFFDAKEHAGKGHHISRMVKNDINKWLEVNGKNMPHYSNNYREQLFNLGSIEKVIGLPVVAIDINNCYWQTAFMLGYITERTYIQGLRRKKEWKIGRNASIGSLSMPTYKMRYKNGKTLPYKPSDKIDAPKEYQYIRNHIIGSIYELFHDLFKHIGADFYMFLTDCVFTDFTQLRKAEEFFTERGYRVKHKTIEFTGINRKEKRVFWYDFEAENKKKFYWYSDSQIIISECTAVGGASWEQDKQAKINAILEGKINPKNIENFKGRFW